MSAVSQFFSPGGFGITGSPSAGWTFNKTAQAGVAETIATFGLSDATGGITIENLSPTDATFIPTIKRVQHSTLPSYDLFQGTTDTGAQPIAAVRFRIGSSTLVNTRPFLDFQGAAGAQLLSFIPLNSGANSAISWGTQSGAAPAFTTRSIGTRAIWSATLSAADADIATGTLGAATLWHSVPRASSSYDHRWYAGTTNIASLRGDGQLTTTGGRVVKVRVALTTPVTVVAGTDHVVISNLTTPGAVAVTLPAGVAGQTVVIKDGKGDANVNNVTITPAAGTIDGAATLVLNTAYARATLVYNGTEWNRID